MPTSSMREPLPAVPRRSLALQWLLPLLITAVVTVVLATGLALSSAMLRRAALDNTSSLLTRGGRQLASVAANGVQQAQVRYRTAAHDSAVHQLLRGALDRATADTVRRTLGHLTIANDSGMPVELWSAGGRRIAFVGHDLPDAIDVRQRSEVPDQPVVRREGLDSIAITDSLQVGSLYMADGRVHFWLVTPVVEHQRAVGYILQQRQLSANPQTDRTLRELTGTPVAAYYGNADRRFWSTIGGRPTTDPHRPAEGMIESEARIAGTPFTFVLETPRAAVLAAPDALIKRLAVVALALTIAGALLAWFIGRRVAKPIVRLTTAAESVARGNYATRVPSGGPEEIARLAVAFNEMSGRIGDASAQLEQREAEFRALADAIPQLAWMADATGHVFWYNRRWYEYTGTTPDQMKADGWRIVHDPELLPAVERQWADAVARGQRLEIEHTLRSADGASRWFLTRVEPLTGRDGKVVRWFGTNTDIQVLRDARESAKAASRAKSDFLATMSHELRTPLNAIGGYVDLLEFELRGPVTDAQRRDFTRIRANQQHLLGLINSVLDLSRIESGRLAYQLEPIAVDPLLAGLDALVGPQAASKELTLEYAGTRPDLVVIGDREKLRQILLNLLSNAIRNTPSGGHISMHAVAADTRVEISVRDNGPGIPLDKQTAIFEPFVQLDRSLTQSREGVGLGLAISRDLALGMGGELSVISSPGMGACFTISLARGGDELLGYQETGEHRGSPMLSVDGPAATAPATVRVV